VEERGPDRRRDDRHTQARSFGLAMSIGPVMAACILLGYGFGVLVDRWAGIKPYGMAIGILVGIAAAFRELLKIAQRLSEEPPASGGGSGENRGDRR
jgi:F0F1-type ATP synthase assembly protein I